MTCQTCEQLLSKCAEALVGAAQPVAVFDGPCDTVIFHGGQYSEEAYDHIAELLRRMPEASVLISCHGGTFQAPETRTHKSEADVHKAKLKERKVKNPIEIDPVATNTREEIVWAAARKEVEKAANVCALTTDVHALRLSLTYIHAPKIQPTFLRPGVWQLDLIQDRTRILQEIYRILLYGMVDNEKPTEAARMLFLETVDHVRTEHPDEHASLLAERAGYIREHFDVEDPLVGE